MGVGIREMLPVRERGPRVLMSSRYLRHTCNENQYLGRRWVTVHSRWRIHSLTSIRIPVTLPACSSGRSTSSMAQLDQTLVRGMRSRLLRMVKRRRRVRVRGGCVGRMDVYG